MAGEWLNALMQMPNAGASFAHGFEQAQQRKRQQMLDEQQMRERQEDRTLQRETLQMQRDKAGLEQYRESIQIGGGILHRIIRENPNIDKPTAYKMARSIAIANRVPHAELSPPEFDERYFDTLYYSAEPQKGAQPTEMERNFEFLQGRDPGLAEQYIRNRAEGAPLIANNGDGTFTIIPRNSVQQGGPQPGAVEDGYRFKGGNPADPNAWEPVNGGQTPQASGNFRP